MLLEELMNNLITLCKHRPGCTVGPQKVFPLKLNAPRILKLALVSEVGGDCYLWKAYVGGAEQELVTCGR